MKPSIYDTELPARRILGRSLTASPEAIAEVILRRAGAPTTEAVRRHLDDEMAQAARRFDACVGIGFSAPVRR